MLVLGVAITTACASPEPSERLRVVATLPPLAALAEAIGGDRVDVRVVLGPRDDPELHALTPKAASALATADVVLAAGTGAVALELALLDAIDRPGGPVVVLLRPRDERPASHRRGHHHDHDEDPHLWLDPDAMRAAARQLAARLAELDAGNGDAYATALDALDRRIGEVDRALRERLARGDRVLLTEHPTWNVLARRYGVRVLAIEEEEREPGARRLREIIDRARAAGVRTLAVDGGGHHRLASTVARELGVVIVVLEPLAYDWLGSLERAAALVAAPGDG